MKGQHFYSRLLMLSIALFVSCMAFAQNADKKMVKLPDGIEKVTSVEGITEYRLKSNGLKILLFPDQSKPTITVNITYLVGSRHEGYGETGMAHLLEHMVFKGSPGHPDIPQELTEHGAQPNGTTWYDRTNYFETFNATEENLRWALDMEADRMVNSFIKKEDLESEMTVVRNEFEIGENSPTSILMERVLATSYIWHNYGNTTIGARADLENVPIERLQAFYRKYYQPDNAVLVVAGKINEGQVLGMIKEYFEKIPKPTRKLIPTYTKEPTQDGERSVTLRRSGDVQVVSAAYHTPPGSHPEHAAIAILDEVLTNQPSGRLYKALVETQKASSVWSFAPALKEGGFLYINADVRMENSLEDAEKTLVATLDSLAENPPTDEEVERARKRILKYWEQSFKNSASVGRRASEFIAMGDWRLSFLFRDNIEKVTSADVIDALRKYLKPSNRTIGKFIPDKSPDRSEIPDAPDVQKMLEGYTGKEAIAEGEDFDPSCENIEKRTVRGVAPDKGIAFALLPKQTRGNSVNARLTLRFGNENDLKGKETAGQFVASLLDKGTSDMTRQEIQDEYDRLKATVWTFGGASSATVMISTERQYLPEVIKLVGKILKAPSFPEEEFAKEKEKKLARIESNRSDPQAVANKKFSRIMNPYPKGDTRYVMTFDEEIEAINKLSLDEVKDFYQTFYGTTDATMAVVGDFDEETIKQTVLESFSGWKSPKGYARIPDPYQEIKPVNETINTPDKANAMFFAGMPLNIRDDDPEYPALVMGNFMLGGGFLNSRLAVRIRQNEGLSYGVGSWLSASPYEKSGSFGSYAMYAPENVKKLEAAYKEEVQKVLDEGFTAEELEAAKSGYIQKRGMGRSNDRSMSGKLNNYLQLGRTMEWDAEMEKKIQALTPEQINNAMKKYIDVDKLVIVKAGDFEKVVEP
ncbi:MAG TPA: insulinase family protein [Bacteroidetes bacterium]|nr:insulinase family protein [Bacteroidota bacterium]